MFWMNGLHGFPRAKKGLTRGSDAAWQPVQHDFGAQALDWTRFVFELIDMRSFSNLWYWIALAVTWSTASHWVLGVPFDMVLRARRHGGEAERDLEDMVRVNVNRLMQLTTTAGLFLLVFVSFVLTMLGILGFWYQVEFCQAVFLLAFPLTIVGFLSANTARLIQTSSETGEVLRRHMSRHRVWVQVVGMISIFVTAFWGMLQNFNVSVLGN
jgi:hypothetical protein